MRPAQAARLLFIGWVAFGFWTQASVAAPRLKKEKKAATQLQTDVQTPIWSERVEGRADTLEMAEELALLHAEDALIGYLRSRTPRVQRIPSPEYIKANLMTLVAGQELANGQDSPDGERYFVVYEVGVTKEKFKELLAFDRHERIFLVCKGLAGIVAVLVALACYFRLEESTKGYYTTWLRVGAVAFVLAAGASLLVFA
jgi:hypothetical protein